MSVIERAEKRLNDEIRQNDLGAENGHLLAYWSAYLDGVRAQKRETIAKWHEACLDGRVPPQEVQE